MSSPITNIEEVYSWRAGLRGSQRTKVCKNVMKV